MQISNPQQQMMMRMAISEIFQKMFFLVPQEEICPAKENQIKCYVAISQKPDTELKLCLLMDRALAHTLSENFMGIDRSEISESDIISTVLEILNMVAGNFLNQIDPEGKYELGIPTCGNPSDGEISVFEEMSFDSNTLSVFLRGAIL